MYQNVQQLTRLKGGQLLLLGVLKKQPEYSAISYYSDHDQEVGGVYLTPDLDEPDLWYRIVNRSPIKQGWWMFHPDHALEHPFFRLMAPAGFLVMEGEVRGNPSEVGQKES